MFRNRIFRERALVRSTEPEPLDDPAQVTAPHEWMLLAALAVILAGVLVWSVFGTVERTLSSDGVLVYSGERHAVLSGVSGNIAEIFVNVGDKLEAESTIARIQVPDLEWQVRVARARVASLEDEAGMSAGSGSVRQGELLTTARAELAEFEALKSEGGLVVSPNGGELTALYIEPGQTVSAGMTVAEVRAGEEGVLEAVTVLTAEQAQRIGVGMPARVALTIRDRAGAQVVAAEVADISSRLAKSVQWLARLGTVSDDLGDKYLVRLALTGKSVNRVPDGAPCQVEIVLGEHPPLGLLVTAGRQS